MTGGAPRLVTCGNEVESLEGVIEMQSLVVPFRNVKVGELKRSDYRTHFSFLTTRLLRRSLLLSLLSLSQTCLESTLRLLSDFKSLGLSTPPPKTTSKTSAFSFSKAINIVKNSFKIRGVHPGSDMYGDLGGEDARGKFCYSGVKVHGFMGGGGRGKGGDVGSGGLAGR